MCPAMLTLMLSSYAGEEPDDAVRLLPVSLRRGALLFRRLLRHYCAARVGGGLRSQRKQQPNSAQLADLHVERQRLQKSAAGPSQVRVVLSNPGLSGVSPRSASSRKRTVRLECEMCHMRYIQSLRPPIPGLRVARRLTGFPET